MSAIGQTSVRTRRVLALAALAASLAPCALAYAPLPWDDRDSHIAPPPPRRSTPSRHRRGTKETFGTFGTTFDCVARPGGVDGLQEGFGYSVAIPATLPGWLLYGLLVDPVAVFAPVAAESWSSGFRGEGLGSAPVLDEVAFEFIYSLSSHKDEAAGGDLMLTRYALGMRATGPSPAERKVRASASLGWCWHVLAFDRREDLDASGPYAGIGLEVRLPAYGDGTSVGFTLAGRWDWVSGLDGLGGRLTERTSSLCAGVQITW